jgi:hypothetical protein
VTKEEIRAFVEKTMRDAGAIGWFDAAGTIAAAWESDVEAVVEKARETTDADPCDGPCCTGVIDQMRDWGDDD